MDGEEERHVSFPRDLLRRFSGGGRPDEQPEASRRDAVEIELSLSLGLSLGGSFGAEPSGTKLVRSSSIAALPMLPFDPELVPAAPLVRTCSLPAEADEELRKRKEMQSLKRLEAKRKRMEKRSLRWVPPGVKEGLEEVVAAGKEQGELGGLWRFPSGVSANGVSVAGLSGGSPRYFAMTREGSIGSQGSSSSGVSEFEGRMTNQGLSREAGSSSVSQPVPMHANHKAAVTCPVATHKSIYSGRDENDLLKSISGSNSMGEVDKSMMEEMPCVSTKGEGPNGRRIEGFLYKYRKGEEVRIVCVCHGSFLTPAEFVKHAGGGDVAHPLKHIVVNPSPSAFL